jgi:hypothetical protein
MKVALPICCPFFCEAWINVATGEVFYIFDLANFESMFQPGEEAKYPSFEDVIKHSRTSEFFINLIGKRQKNATTGVWIQMEFNKERNRDNTLHRIPN